MYKYLLNKLPRPLLIRLSYTFRKVAPLLYIGNNVECPVCEKSYRKFLPYGSNTTYRKNVLCPNDLTLERHRLIWLYLKNDTDFFTKRKSILHIAPEQCFLDKFKANVKFDYVTADLESPIADLHFDIHNIPIESNLYQVIFCNHVLEHVEDASQCLSELYRVMQPGGWGIFQVPQDFNRAETYEDPSITSPEEREKHYWQKDHLRLFGTDYPEWLKKAGFEVEEFSVKEQFSEDEINRYRLMENEILYIARKT